MVKNKKKKERFSSKITNKVRMPTLITLIQHSTTSPTRAIRQEKRSTNLPNRKGKSKSIFINDMILYIKNPKDSTKQAVRTGK